MKSIIIALTVLFALVAQAEDFTNVPVSVTWTNADPLFFSINDPTMQQKELQAKFDGKNWKGFMTLYRSDGVTVIKEGSFGQSKLLKAANDTAGITMDANASNVLKKLDKIVEKALKREGNGIINRENLVQ